MIKTNKIYFLQNKQDGLVQGKFHNLGPFLLLLCDKLSK